MTLNSVYTKNRTPSAESIGWIPLDEGAYLHVGSDAPVIQVVGVAKEEMAGSNVLWLL